MFNVQSSPVLPRFRWQTAAAGEETVERLASELNLPSAVAGVLAVRGLHDSAAAARFLDPRLQHLGDPLAFPGIAAAADRIWAALRQGEPVVVFGDFDADGVTATALLTEGIRSLGGKVEAFLPDRIKEGYGLTRAALQRCLAEHAAQLLITVDCGITAAGEVAYARSRGLDVIVTDHHEASAEIPDALAVVNPRLGASPGAEHLCGAGVAFKLMHALLKQGRLAGHVGAGAYDVRAWLDAVAVATVADVVPLLGENRVLVAAGLSALAHQPRVGLKALKARAGLLTAPTSRDLAFVFGPRLNAAGRMRSAWPALHLLHATDWDGAMALAVELEQLNAERRGVESDLLQAAQEQLAGRAPAGAVVVAGEGWHVGTVGIVAARLCDVWNVPAAVLSLQADGSGRGSVRGCRGDDVVAALGACRDMLAGFGGHPRAAGFHLKAGAVNTFREAFAAACQSQREGGDARPQLDLDGWLAPRDVGSELWSALQRLEPHGEGHGRPRWGMRNLRLTERPTPVGGEGEHLRLAFRGATGPVLRGVWFRMGRLAETVAQAGPLYDAAFELHENTYGGRSSIELQLVDLRQATQF